MEIIFISLDNIDRENNKIISRKIDINDAKDYINSLIEKILHTDKKREFESKKVSYTMSVINQIVQRYVIKDLVASTTETSVQKESTDSYLNFTTFISQKLLQEQLIAQNKYKHLNEIQKGSLVQALVLHDNKIIYLSCLVEHTTFIDENDLKYKIGLPTSDKATLKSCIIYHSIEGDIDNIYLTDSRSKFTEYWYDGFLELFEKHSDRTNTKQAYNLIKSHITNGLSKSSKADCNALTNSLNVFFSQTHDFTFDNCLDFLFNEYKPQNAELNLTQLRDKIENKATSIKLDTVFAIDNSDIELSLKNTKYYVTDNIELKLKTPKKNLNDYIYSDKLKSNEKILVIRNINEETYSKFLKKDN